MKSRTTEVGNTYLGVRACTFFIFGWISGLACFLVLLTGKTPFISQPVMFSPMNCSNLTEKQITALKLEMQEAQSCPPPIVEESKPTYEPGSSTIVAIWFFLDKSKHGNQRYIEWAKFFCKVEANIFFWWDRITIFI